MTDQVEGVKADDGRDPWELLPWGPTRDVVRVLAHGQRKYSAWNWVHVPHPRRRYFAAAMRHLVAWWGGERLDPESGLPHLAHASCNLLFLAHFDGAPPKVEAVPQADDEIAYITGPRR